jgi:hypothetical protein
MPLLRNKSPLNTGKHVYEIKDGIMFIQRLERVQYGLDEIRGNIEERLKFTEGNAYPVVIFGQDMISMDKPSREFLAGEGSRNTLSRAFVVDKPQARLQLHFFLKTREQPVPTEIFNSLEEAIEWSKQFRQI